MKKRIISLLIAGIISAGFVLSVKQAMAAEGGGGYLGCIPTPPVYDPYDYKEVWYLCYDGSSAMRCECAQNIYTSCNVSNQDWPCPSPN